MKRIQEVLPIAITEETDRDAFLDNAIKVMQDFGFRQILPTMLEDHSFFTQDEWIKNHFHEDLVPILNSSGKQSVLNPTHLFSTFKRYINSVNSRGSHLVRWFYISPLMENPKAEEIPHHEIGIFVLGDDSPFAHAHLISSVNDILGSLGVPEFVVELNNIGCTSCQRAYFEVFRGAIGSVNALCDNCRFHLEQNPFRIWSCGKAECQSQVALTPPVIDFLDERCRSLLMNLLETVDELAIPYMLSPSLSGNFVREKILFNVSTPGNITLGEGGNFSAWSKRLGAQDEIPLIGFVTTFEKLWSQIPTDKRKLSRGNSVFVIPLGDIAMRKALVLKRDLKQAGVKAGESMLGNSGIKGQLKDAQEAKVEISLIIGQKEALDHTVILRDMRSGMQELFASDRIIEEVKKRLE